MKYEDIVASFPQHKAQSRKIDLGARHLPPSKRPHHTAIVLDPILIDYNVNVTCIHCKTECHTTMVSPAVHVPNSFASHMMVCSFCKDDAEKKTTCQKA